MGAFQHSKVVTGSVFQVGVVKIYFNIPILAEQWGKQKKVKRQRF